jgi:hypothetical protein
VDDEGVDVRCSPARSVALSSGVWDGCKVNAGPLEMNWRGRETERSDDGLITAARFELPEFQTRGRVEVLDASGDRAWGRLSRAQVAGEGDVCTIGVRPLSCTGRSGSGP